MAKTLKIGSVGLGRLGYEHAKNIANYVTGAELTAICDTDAARVAQVAEELNVPYTYTDVAEMVKNPELDAIVVVSPSMFHAEHIKLALDAGKHCFATSRSTRRLKSASWQKRLWKHIRTRYSCSASCAALTIPTQRPSAASTQATSARSFSSAPTRRTPAPPSRVRSSLHRTPVASIWICACHDLDLIRWFTGAEVKRVWAIGGVFEFDLYRELNDADNCCATVQLDNGAMGFMFTNRTHGAGCNVETEIIGTHGTLRIANVGAKNLLQIVDGSGRTRGVLSGLPQPLASGLYQRDPGVRILPQRGPQARCHRLRRHQGFSGGIPLQGIL